MANGNFEIQGYEELLKKLAGLSQDLQGSIEEEALEEGAKPIRDAVEQEAPVSDVDKKHAKDNIIIVKRSKIKGRIYVQPAPDYYYLKFPEFGTSSQPANPFFERALNKSKEEARRRIAAVIQRRLGL